MNQEFGINMYKLLYIKKIDSKKLLYSTGNCRLPQWLSDEESACQPEDTSLTPGWGRSPGEGNGNPLQYYCLENPMDRGAWQAAVYGVAKVGHD